MNIRCSQLRKLANRYELKIRIILTCLRIRALVIKQGLNNLVLSPLLLLPFV